MKTNEITNQSLPLPISLYGRLRQMTRLAAAMLLLGAGEALGQTGTETATRARQTTPQASKRPPAPSALEVGEARRRLSELGFWVKTEGDGDEVSLRHALIAFQKIEGRSKTGVLTEGELRALRAARIAVPRETGFAHIEIDLCRQVLFLVELDGVPLRILPVSTGSGECFTEGGRTRRAVTPLGRFVITHKIKGWRKSPLGLLYYPNYIYGGVAIHGNPSVPAVPASHGCIRIPMFAAEEFSNLTPVGMAVIIYDSVAIID
jgi:N-acetylmuramoyl-L-alanine amidase